MSYPKLLYMFLLLLTSGCSSNMVSDDSYLLVISTNDNLNEIKGWIYIEPTHKHEENKNRIDSLGYTFKFLFYSKDGYVLIPCCVFKQINNLSVDTEKLLTEIPEKEFDSLSVYYGKRQKIFYHDLPQITDVNNGYKVQEKNFTLRIFKANGIKYCECSYGYQYSEINLPDGSEAFITELNKVEELNLKEQEFIDSNLNKILSNIIIEQVIKSIK